MRVVLIDAHKQTPVADLEIAAITPLVNDIVAHPTLGNFRVVQRAFILEEGKLVKLGVKPRMEVVLQIAVVSLPAQEASQNAGN